MSGCLFLLTRTNLQAAGNAAQTGWTGGSSALWNNVGNWTNGTPNTTTNSTGNAARILNFGPLGNARPLSTNDMPGASGTSLNQVFFNAGATNYFIYLYPGSNAPTLFDFNGQVPKFENDSANLQTVDMPFKLSGLNGGAGGEIDPSQGDIVLTTNANVTLLLSTQLRFFGSAGHVVTFNAPILGGTTNSCVLESSASAGAKGPFVIFASTNTCTNTFILGGTARFAAANVTTNLILLGDTATTPVTPATLQMDNGLLNNSPISVRAGSGTVRTIGNTAFGAGTAVYTGPVGLGTNLTTLVDPTGSLELDGNFDFQNPSGLNPRTLTVSGTGNTLIAGNLTNASTGISVVTKTNSGTLTLGGTTNAVRIMYNLGGGVLSITNGGAIGIPAGVNYPDKFSFTASAMLSVTNSFTLGRYANGSDNAGFRINGGSTGTFDVAAGSTLTIDGPVIDLPATGSGSLAKTSAGTLVLQQSNSYSGNTIISAGRLAVSGSGSISNTASIIIGSGAMFDVSGLPLTFTLGSSQTLSNNTSTATLAGNLNSGFGTVSLTFASGTPALAITNGTLTLSAGTVFKVNNLGAALGAGSYKIIAAFTGGTVAGTLPSVAVGGGGTTAAASLQLIGGELYLVVGATGTALASSANPSGYLDTLTFTANVQTNGVTAGDATGNVTFLANGSPFSTNALSGGSATSIGLNSLPRGTNLIVAVYAGDANYLAGTNSLNQVVTNHPPVAGNVVYLRNAALSTYHIAISQLLTNVTDADGDSIALAGVSVTTNGIVLVTGGGYLSYQNTNAVNDQFTYTVTDGFGGTNSGTVTFIVDTNALFGQNSPSISTAGGFPTVSFAGIPGYAYSIQRSTNLPVWVTIWTTNAPSNGLFNFTDNFSDLGVTPVSAFYRLGWQP